ncbi:hypothetical protein MOZ60_10660 [Stecheria sp. CLA-KB-P133]|uniref:Uncharacterized protein n=1 Tax=Grylomicrobium aquisgranensis TaxID=2926318 RepID=A0AB35U4U0_9FIRM|nr:hypothetical protein [Stecheria sp. CLA-KB-P133]
MNDEHKTHNAHELSQMDNADQVNARENKNGAAATTTATPDDEHLDNIMFSENVDKDSASYRLYHMSLQEWEGMSTDQKKLLLESLTDQEKTDIRKFSKFEVTDLASMPLEKAKAAYFTSVSQGSFTRLTNKMADPNGVAKIAADTISRSFVALADFEPLREAAEPTGEELKMLREQLAALSKQFQKVLKELTAPETIRRMAAEQAFEAEARELQPYIEKELKKPEYNGRDFLSIMGDYAPLEPAEAAEDPSTELGRVIAAARKMAARDEDLKRSTALAALLEKGSNLPVLHGMATDQFSYLSDKDMLPMTTADMMHEVTRYQRKDGKWIFRIGNSRNARQQAVNADKILKVSQALYTAQSGKERGQNKAIEIPLDWYMQQVYPSTVKQDNADKAKEKNRLKNARKFARASINDDLETLFNSSVSWTECRNGSKTKDYHDYRIIDGKGIENGLIKVHITDALAQYFNSCPLTYFPIALLSISSRNPNAYRIGNLFAQHAYMVTNIVYQTADHLKVETVLQNTDLPSYEELKTAGKEDISRKWEERIKDPLEESLEILRRQEVIDDWYYCKVKGEPLTDEEATFTSYEQYRDAQICYVMHNPVDNAEAVMKKKEQISTARKKKRRKEAAKAKKKEENAGQK